ncbi:hypothetical protein [uncultured Muribaculum sp.]|uniref:hypothetical protein n=1 Tax=uncultured Muribaculum sp. TaxID=1918613 RepID=UPI0025E17D6F|nr:hypothetical protein [uncultured Muribaculum sp.]
MAPGLELQRRIAEKKAVIGIFGLSQHGLRMAVSYARAGFKVICLDLRDFKVDMLRRGINFVRDISDSELLALVKRGLIVATPDFSLLRTVDYLAICVPSREAAAHDAAGAASDGSPSCDIAAISGIVASNIRPGLIIGIDDRAESIPLRSRMEAALSRTGFRYGFDYLFGTLSPQ